MDIPPYTSSSAFSREQYALVRKVELATLPNVADGYILASADTLRTRLLAAGVGLASNSCKEALLLLLYCATAISPANAGSLDVSFAFPHAVNLAEAAPRVQDRAIGYLFCRELLPRDHALQLMLVNTIRKDLESDITPRIVLALDALIGGPSADVIPAVQRRLLALAAHHSPHVRRRALLAVRALAPFEPDMLRAAHLRVLKCAEDREPEVVNAALRVCDVMAKHEVLSHEIQSQLLDKILCSYWDQHKTKSTRTPELLPLLQSIASNGPNLSSDGVRAIFEIIRQVSSKKARADSLLLESFRVLSALPAGSLPPTADLAGRRSPAHALRPLLTESAPNAHFLFLVCLARLPARLWAGAEPELPPVLSAGEVGRVMTFLDSPDGLIRRKTLGILHAVDPAIVGGFRARLLESRPAQMEGPVWNEYVVRLCEVAAAAPEDGGVYIASILDTLGALDAMLGQTPPPVQERAVENVLSCLRDGSEEFRVTAVAALLAPGGNVDFVGQSPTRLVLVAALACAHAMRLPIPPASLLQQFADGLPTLAPPIQDAVLLCMLRLCAECETVPEEAVNAVRVLAAGAGRYIRRRCEQFLTYVKQLGVLKRLVSGAPSAELPEFLGLLQMHETRSPRAGHASLPTSPQRGLSPLPSSPGPLAASKLRYAAYPAPGSPPTLKHRALSPAGSMSPQRARRVLQMEDTLTPGDLALSALELDTLGTPASHARREDLISLDSPFLADPTPVLSPASVAPAPDFAATWAGLASFTARGWCALPRAAALRRLQSLRLRLAVIPPDQAPFEGSLKVVATQTKADTDSVDSAEEATAALRLDEGADESCLWQMRCDGAHLADRIREVLSADG